MAIITIDLTKDEPSYGFTIEDLLRFVEVYPHMKDHELSIGRKIDMVIIDFKKQKTTLISTS